MQPRHTTTAEIADRCSAMPVFPLPTVVLLPGGNLPLHIFEPRYRSLIEHALEGDRLLAVATIKPSLVPPQGPPALFERAGIGKIVEYHPLDDGRSNVVLEGVGVMTLERELTLPKPYRVFEGHYLSRSMAECGSEIAQIRALLLKIGSEDADTGDFVGKLLTLGDDALVHGIAGQMLRTPGARLSFLFAESARQQALLVVKGLAAQMARTVAPVGDA